MHRRQYRDVRPHEHIRPDLDRRAVQAGKVEIHIAVLADLCEAAVVKLHRPLQIGALMHAGEKLAH